jgi:uncharacterized membrane-anchored protein YitT (DUF2179 family)
MPICHHHVVHHGIAAEVTTNGPDVVRTAIIITDKPEEVSRSISRFRTRVTSMDVTGKYTGTKRSLLYCVITRSEVSVLKSLVLADPSALWSSAGS